MDLNTIAVFALTEFLLSLTPGPAVLLVIGLSIPQGFRVGFMATLGILSTNAIFFTLSALGIGALIVANATLFTIIKWIGAVSVVLELPILVFYGYASALSARLIMERVIEWIETVGGGILIALGGALATSQHRSR